MRVYQYGAVPGPMLIPSSFDPPDETVSSLTPVARWDVVPWQRVSTTFKAGIVAFSKEGVYGVEVTPSGQGYSGDVLTATEMTYNSRTDVWEYWVSISPGDFTSEGAITLAATVYGEDGGRRTLDTIVLYVDTGTLSQPEAWVTTTGNNATAELDNSGQPYSTIPGALNAIEAAHGTCSGAIVYLGEGEWELGDASILTSTEWLTFDKVSGTTTTNVIVHGSGSVTSTERIRFHDITLRSDANNDLWLQGWPDPEPTWLWVDTSYVLGSGRWETYTSPVYRNDNWFCTDTYITNTGISIRFADIVRNVVIEDTGEDAVFLSDMAINVTIRNQDPNINENDATPTNAHADGWQWAGAGMENIIVYGWHATDIHYQGIFARMAYDYGVHSNSAFVNVLIEPRYPRRPGFPGDVTHPYETIAFYGPMDHVLFWHVTSVVDRGFNVYNDGPAEVEFTNCSFVGNVFGAFMDWAQGDTNPVPYGQPGNAGDNEFIHNHYVESYVDEGGSLLYSKSPDTVSGGSQSLGDPDIVTTLDAADYGTPNVGSVLLNRLTEKVVPIDVFGNGRDATPDVGAIERQ